MNISIMMDELVKVLKEATYMLQLETPKGVFRAPQVADGYLSPKNPKVEVTEDFPYVIARYLNDTSNDEGAMAQVKVICGTYSEDDQRGWRDLLNLTNAIKTYLLAQRSFGGCFSIELPLKREFPEEQPAPEWVGWFTLSVAIPNIQEVDEDVRRILEYC